MRCEKQLLTNPIIGARQLAANRSQKRSGSYYPGLTRHSEVGGPEVALGERGVISPKVVSGQSGADQHDLAKDFR